MRRPGKPENKNGWKHYCRKIREQAAGTLAAGGGVPYMDEGVERKEHATRERGGPGSPRLDGQPNKARGGHDVSTADVADEMEIGWARGGDARNSEIPRLRSGKHPDAIRAQRDAENQSHYLAHDSLPTEKTRLPGGM